MYTLTQVERHRALTTKFSKAWGDSGWSPTRCGMQRSRAWCGTPPILGVVNMVGTRNFTCYMGALCCNNVPSMFRLLDIARFALFAI